MVCKNCGKEVAEGTELCPQCGNKIGGESAKTKYAVIAGVCCLVVVVIVVIFASGVAMGRRNDGPKVNTTTGENVTFTVEDSTGKSTTAYEKDAQEQGYNSSGYINKLIWSTGGSYGTYYAYSKAISEIIATDEYSFEVITSDGSKNNMERLRDGEADLAIVQGDVMNYLYNGINYTDEPITGIRAVASLYDEQVQIVALKNSNINNVEDLKGKTVAVGAYSTSVYNNAVHILEAAGIDIENDIYPIYASFAEVEQSIADGACDAAFITASAPTPAVSVFASSSGVKIVNIGDNVIGKIIEKNPFYTRCEISADTYQSNQSALTVSVKAVLVASDRVSDAQIYQITKDIMERKDEIVRVHAKGNDIDVKKAFLGIGYVPLHSGAESYYRGVGALG